MKKFAALFLVGLLMTLLASFLSVGGSANASVAMAITSTPAESQPTALPTEFLTAVPQPTAMPTQPPTILPTNTSVPTKPPRKADASQPTPAAMPALGMGDNKPAGPDPSSPVTRIQIPALKLDRSVSQVPYDQGDWDISGLGSAVGWLETTSRPELGHNTVLVGHLTLKGGVVGPFVHLDRLKPGMKITIHTKNLVIQYEVVAWAVTDGADTSPLEETDDARLTLITCYQPSWAASSHTYLQRGVIVARPISISEKQ